MPPAAPCLRYASSNSCSRDVGGGGKAAGGSHGIERERASLGCLYATCEHGRAASGVRVPRERVLDVDTLDQYLAIGHRRG